MGTNTMTAQEWLEDYEYWDPKTQPDDVNTAATIIRAQQDRIERLERAVELVLNVVSDDHCPTTEKCPEYGKLVRNCRAHWHKWLMEGK